MLALPFRSSRIRPAGPHCGSRAAALAGVRPIAHGKWGIAGGFHPGNAWFTLIGFMGMYTVLGILFCF